MCWQTWSILYPYPDWSSKIVSNYLDINNDDYLHFTYKFQVVLVSGEDTIYLWVEVQSIRCSDLRDVALHERMYHIHLKVLLIVANFSHWFVCKKHRPHQ